jgi:hypothetical protein
MSWPYAHTGAMAIFVALAALWAVTTLYILAALIAIVLRGIGITVAGSLRARRRRAP